MATRASKMPPSTMRRRQHTNDSFDTLPPPSPQYPSSLSHPHGHTPPLQIPQSTHPFPRSVSPLSSSPTHGMHMPAQIAGPAEQPAQSSKRGFFSRPRWFSRDKTSSLSSASASGSPIPTSPSKQLPTPSPPRASFSLGFRRTTVSTSSSASAGALAPPHAPGMYATASRSLLDVSSLPPVPASPQPSPPRSRGSSHRAPSLTGDHLAGTGDLKSISSKPWSRSMDDFSRFLAGGKGKDKSQPQSQAPTQPHEGYREREREHERRERDKISAYRERGLYAAPPALGASVSTPAMFGPTGGPVTPPAQPSGPPRLATPQPISPLGSPGMLIPSSPVTASPKRSMDHAGGDYVSFPRARGTSPGAPGAPVPFPSSSSEAPSASASTSSLHLPRLGSKGRSISESRVSTLSSLSGSPNRDRDRGRPSEDLPPVPPLPASVSSQPGGGGWFATSRSAQLHLPSAQRGNREAVVPSGSWPSQGQGRNDKPPVPSIPQGIARAASPLKKTAEKEKEKEKEKEPELPPFLALLSPTVDTALAQYAAAARQRNTAFPSGSGGMGLMPEPEKGRGKGDWRVYKASLKGSKVLFYKVPNDRQPAVEAHFPRTLVAIDEKPSPPLHPPPGSAGPSPSATKVRKRAFWGKGRHPDWRRAGMGEEEGEDAWEGTGEAVAHECVFRSFVAERKRDTMGSLAPSLPTAGRPEEIPLPEDLPDDFPENAPEAAVEKQDPFVLGAMAVMPLLWGNEFWAEIEKRVETMEVGQEREEAVRRLRRPMLAVWGKEMCEALEGEGELVEGSPRPPMRCSVSEAMEKKLRVGLDVSTFLSLSPEVVARSLKAYHAQRFPSPFTPSSLLSAEMDPWMYSLAPDANDEPMHPLTRLVMLHVLVESRTCEERRAAVKGWAEVLGAGPGYAAAEAIRRAFGSAPVARLEDLAELVEGATFVEDDGRGVWRGGRKALKQLLEVTRKDEGRWGVREMKHVWDAVEKHWKSWTVEQSEDIGEDGDVGALVQFWEDQAGENDVTYQTISSFLPPSLAAQAMSLSKAQSRMNPFARTITSQLDKLKRDRQTPDRLAHDIRVDKENRERKESESNRMSMQAVKKPTKGGHKKGRSVTAFFRVVRPVSTVFGAELPELDFTATSKPALSLSLVHATARPLPNEVRSFTFTVETEDGGRYVLQAANLADREHWMNAIGKAAQISAARRSLMEANVPKMDLQNSDWEARPPSQHPKSVYGVTLATVLEREGNQLTERGVPLIISQLIEEVERRGLTETGIYRISGSKAAIENIRNSIDKGLPIEMVIDEYTDIYAICDAIKQWFRDLPESILPATLLKDFDQALKIEEYNARMFRIQDLVVGLPRANFLCLRVLAEHLYKITDYEDQNQMHADNLATVWAPTLCRLPNAAQIPIFQMFGVLGPATGIVKQCILQYHWLFNEADEAEPESGADTELQTPTAEAPAVEERRFSMTVNHEGAVVVQEEPLDRRSSESKSSSGMSMPNIDVTGPTPEPSVDSHGEYGTEDDLQPSSHYPTASTSTRTEYP